MAEFIHLNNRAAINKAELPGLGAGEDVHITIIHDPSTPGEVFLDPEIAAESNLTVIDVPSGEFGAGPSIYDYIHSNGMLLALSGVIVFGHGF